MADHILTEGSDFLDTEGSDRLITETSATVIFFGSQSQLHDDPFALQLMDGVSVVRGSFF